MNRTRRYRTFVILALSFVLVLFIAKAYYDTNTIEVKHYQIKESHLGEALAGLKVALLSDLHIRKIDVRENRILKILHEEKPDLILLLGDYISFKGLYEPVMSFFHQFRAPYGVYGVLGNTEYSNENGSCILCHNERSKDLKEKQNPIFLRNSVSVFEANHKRINIIGVDDPVNKKSDLQTTLKKAKLSGPSVLLAHSPEIFEEASNYGIDLVLSGHNHGGQIFITKILRKFLPFDPVLEFLEGFYQEGKSLMYVSRGVGTSYLPFRLGVKPEITFFEFTNSTNEETNDTNGKIRMARIKPTAQSSVLSPDDSNSLPPTSNLQPPTEVQQHSSTAAQKILFDFESNSELEKLNWECHKWFELSEKNATSGKHSLKVSLPPGQYPGISFGKIWGSWSGGKYFGMDVFNPSEERVTFHIRIDDNKSGWEYGDRFDINFELKQGMNHISIPTDSIRTNIHYRPLNLKQVERMMVFVPNNSKRRELYIDNIRLE